MSLNISLLEEAELKPKIKILGVGGAGGNAVNNMHAANLQGVEFLIANTDAQALNNSQIQNKIQLGTICTQGLGAGSHPEVGKAAAEEALPEIKAAIEGCNMLFVTAGMGGGTGTGAAPVIAKAAKEMGILVVGVVTKPFHFEGARRMRVAESGLEGIFGTVDTLIIIPNQNLFRIANEKTTFVDAFRMADNILHSGVRSVTDLITMPGLINLDFSDIRTVMQEMGKAMMGTGEAEGDDRAIKAAEAAISNPLLDNSSMKGAKGVLINITGGVDMTLFEVDEAANRIREEVDSSANIIFGSAFNEELQGKLRVSVVATGIDSDKGERKSEEPKRIPDIVHSSQNKIPQREERPEVADKPSITENDVLITATFSQTTSNFNVMSECKEGDAEWHPQVNQQKKPFIPPKPVDPEERQMYFEEKKEVENESIAGVRPAKHEKIVEKQPKITGLFGKMVPGFYQKPLSLDGVGENIESNSQKQEGKSDLFDIPSFLRKKK